MKQILSLLFLITAILITKSQVKDGFVIPAQPKIGLSLSGGGAKGFAHVGVLKVIDSLGIKIDYISGTSMGAIVGGLYASGYTAKDIEKIVMDTDFYSLLANEKNRQEKSFYNKANDKYLLTVPIKNGKINVLPKAISSGQKNIYLLKELFKNVSSVSDFSKLPIPFLCTATNLETGKLKVLDKGDLVNSIMASSAFPSLMNPVKIGDSLYIDGAITLNYPSKLLKDRGINIVIGVDLSQGLSSKDQLNSAIDILNQVVDFGIQKETKLQYQYTDINIHPNLEGINATSYDEKSKILKSGYDEAQKYQSFFSQLPKRDESRLRAPFNPIFSNVYKIDSLVLENNKIFNKDYILGKMNLKLPSLQTFGSINKMVDKLYATNNYTLINYDIIQKEKSKTFLKLQVTEDETRFFLKLGLHYDEVFKTGLLLNASAKRFIFKNSTVGLDVVVGDRPRYYFNYFIDNGYILGFGISSSGMKFSLRDQNDEIKDQWTWLKNDVFIQSTWKDKYAVGAGLSQEYFETSSKNMGSGNFLNPFAFIKSDTQDDRSFPTRGIYINAEGKILDLFNKQLNEKAIQVKGNFNFNFPFSPVFTYRLSLFGGFTIGNSDFPYYQYHPGGIFGQNLGNFVTFPGLYFGNLAENNVITALSNFQFKIKKNYFITGDLNLLNYFNDITFVNFINIKQSSLGVSAGYRSSFGQIKLIYSKSLDKNNKGVFNIILGHWF